MRIENYFQQMRAMIDACEVVQASKVTYDKRGTHAGFIHGEVFFVDGSQLHMREYVDTEFVVERLTYVYHYTDLSGRFVFRYDNTGHHRRLNLPTYPHHKHDGDEGSVIVSSAPDLKAVLDEAQTRVQLP